MGNEVVGWWSGKAGERESHPQAKSRAEVRESISAGDAWRHLKTRQEWASQDQWCKVTCARTMAWDVWHGRTRWECEAMGPAAKMWSMAVARGAPWRVVKLVGLAGGMSRCLVERELWVPSAKARGVPGAPVLLRSPRRTLRSGVLHESDFGRPLGVGEAGGGCGLNRRARPRSESGIAEAIKCGPL